MTTDQIRADFDHLAALESDGWNHNSHYHSFLLAQLPEKMEIALDLGCGTGAFTRLLAAHSRHVIGLDLSPLSLEIARQRSVGLDSVEYVLADALAWQPPDRLDAVVSIATLHHLPAQTILPRLAQALRPGGVLAVLDLYQPDALDALTSIAAAPLSLAYRLARTGRLREPRAVREAWAAHSPHDSYLSLVQVRQLAGSLLPGAVVRRHLFWRYSLVWCKPDPLDNDEESAR